MILSQVSSDSELFTCTLFQSLLVILCGHKMYSSLSREVSQWGIWCKRRDSLGVITSGSQLWLEILTVRMLTTKFGYVISQELYLWLSQIRFVSSCVLKTASDFSIENRSHSINFPGTPWISIIHTHSLRFMEYYVLLIAYLHIRMF